MTRVLIVDDKPDNLYFLRALLQGNGCEVEEARHGAEALVRARQNPPELVISDLLMPVMDGYTLLRHWKSDERLRSIPFIVYTATYTEPKDERLALDLGADAFVIKPAEPEPFMVRIQQVLAQHHRAELSPPREAQAEDETLLKEYSEVLIRKLEEKSIQLEQSNRALLEDIARRDLAESHARQSLAETERARSALLSILEDQRHVEAALRDSEQRFASIFRASPVGVCLSRFADGIFLDANDAFLQIVGHTRTELIGRSSLELSYWLDPHDRSQLVTELVEAGSVHEWEVGFRRKDGSIGHSLRSLERLTLGGEDCILTVLSDITARKLTEQELQASRERLEILSRQLIATQETERRHLARELHDEIGQALTGIKLNLNALQQPTLSPEARLLIHNSIDVVDQTLHQARNLALDLRPSMLDDIGLVAALRWCLDRQSKRAGFVPHFVDDPSLRRASQEIETACFRIAQESLTNIARHAKARNVHMELRQLESELELFIQDDGIGFDVPAARNRATHGASIGLLGMSERTQLLGGHFEIESIPSQGTTIHARIPLKSDDSHEPPGASGDDL